MMKTTAHLPVLLLLAVLLFRCGTGKASAMSGESRSAKESGPALQIATSANAFGLSLFEKICELDREGNVFVSPVSIATALAMAMDGAKGSTREAMKKVLEMEGLRRDTIDQGFADLAARFSEADSTVTLVIANSLWYRKGLPIERDYVSRVERLFEAAVRPIDFSSPDAPGVINSWVSENTHGKIEEIVESIQTELVLFLIDAIYFKGTWTVEFDEDMTREEPFLAVGGDTVSCRMMGRKGEFPYCETDLLQAIELPYGTGEFSMVLLLPRAGTGMDSLLSGLTAEGLADLIDRLRVQEGRLDLPKFRLAYDITLNDALADLGMGEAFDPRRADFTGILSGGRLYIDKVKHGTFIEVDEKGTEAAAATSVAIALTAVGPSGFVMRVDRPFLFFIRDTGSSAILFAGRVTHPVLD
jgi:serine protease inhibitor